MNNKTAIIILSISVLLFLYIVLVDDKLMSTDEKEARAENVFATLRADLVDKIELKSSKGNIVLEATGKGPGEETSWRVTSPKSLKADDTEVQALISSMDFLIYQRNVTESRDDPKFGFGTPRVTGTVHFKNKRVTFTIGADAPDQDGVYVAVDSESNHFFVTSSDFLDAMKKSVNDLRDKHLLDLAAADIAGITIQTNTEKWTATRSVASGNWHVNTGRTEVLGAASELKQLAAAAADLKIVKFVSDNATDIARYGLDKPTTSIILQLSQDKKTTIDIGGACDENGVYARVNDGDAVHCVATRLKSLVTRPIERYFEKRFLTAPIDDISGIRLLKDSDKIELFKKDNLWHVSGLTDEETSQTAFSELLETLKGFRAETLRFSPLAAETAPDDASPTNRQVPGKDARPISSVTIETAAGETIALSLYSDPANENNVLVKRENSDGWLSYSADLGRLLVPYPLRFRKKEMTQCHQEDANAIEITIGNRTQFVKKSDEHWLITSPESAETDAEKIKKLLALVCETPVTAYPVVQDDPFAPEKIFATVTVSFTQHDHKGETLDNTRTGTATIEIGAATGTQTRFARIKEKPEIVFTVDEQFTEFLPRPLAARNLLSIQSNIINDVTFQNAGIRFRATKKNGQWHSEDCTVDSAAMNRIVIDFGAVKAIDAHEFATDVTNQTAEIQFNSAKNTPPAKLKFGETNLDNDGIIAIRDNLNISFILPARLIRDMSAVCVAE